MGRWGIVLAVCAGVVVGWLVVPSPDTGRAVTPYKPKPAASVSADVPADEPAASGRPKSAEPDAKSLPASTAGTTAPPNEVASASRAIAGWQRISRKLATSEEPGAADLKTEIDGMIDEIKAFRADPANGNWEDLVTRQRDLVSKVRQQGGSDASIDSSIERIEQALNGEVGTTSGPANVPDLAPARPAGMPLGGVPGALPMKGAKPGAEAVELPMEK
jgi:hypothetical protein